MEFSKPLPLLILCLKIIFASFITLFFAVLYKVVGDLAYISYIAGGILFKLGIGYFLDAFQPLTSRFIILLLLFPAYVIPLLVNHFLFRASSLAYSLVLLGSAVVFFNTSWAITDPTLSQSLILFALWSAITIATYYIARHKKGLIG